MLSNKNVRAFTLTELSIVLLVIGLLTVSAIAGRNLIIEQRIQSVVAEYQTYQSAIFNFYNQYQAYPGDMMNATVYWYDAIACPGTTGVAGGCNGNGNGLIEYSGENGRAWQHLKFAGMVQGNYIGSSPNPPQPGITAPGSNFSSDATWDLNPALNYGGNANALFYCSSRGAYPSNTILGLNPLYAYSVDQKIDDGVYNTGNVLSLYVADGVNFTAATGCVTSTGVYNISSNQATCAMQFVIDTPE